MKIIIFFFINLVLVTNIWCQKPYCFSKAVDNKVDSLFCMNFKFLQKHLKEKSPFDSEEVKFLYLTEYISGIEVRITNYSGYPNSFGKKELTKLKMWYRQKKCKILWQNHILVGFKLMNDLGTITDLNELDKINKMLETLRIY